MFKNMSLQMRIVFAFLFMAGLILVVAGVGLFGTRTLIYELNRVSDNTYPTTVALFTCHEAQTAQQSAIRLLLRGAISAEDRRRAEEQLKSATQRIKDGFKDYEATDTDPEAEKIYTDLRKLWDDWDKKVSTMEQLIAQYYASNPQTTGRASISEFPQAQNAVKLFDRLISYEANEAKISFEESEKALLELIDYTSKLSAKTFQQGEGAAKSATFWIIVWSIIGPITAVIFGIIFSNTIAKPLGAKIAKVVSVAERIAQGDLTSQLQEAEIKDEIGRLLDSFRSMTLSLNNLIAQVNQSGIKITSSATQIAASGKQLEATVNEQVASTNEVVATAKEIAATSTELSRVMAEVSHLSEKTTQSASEGQKDLQGMERTMLQLADATASISSRLGVISEKANNINTIVTTITKVADQTNLLSLNAAIEAEKAGEYGLGFAVVAREIRRLADQTAVATLDIESMVQEMQSAVASGVMEMDKFTKEVERGVEDIRNVGGQLSQVISQVQGLAPRFESVNQGMEAQSIGATQISEAMIQLSEAANQTADSLREINRSIEQLNEAGKDLRREISRFQLQHSTMV
jgi:methyl-accepting chemotaxis protein WspA